MTSEKDMEKELGNLEEGWILLLEASAEKMGEVSLAALQSVIAKGFIGIVLSANRPYTNLVDIYKKNKIDVAKLVFLDCVSKSSGVALQQGPNVVYLENVSALTNIAIGVHEAMKRTQGKKVIFIDSLTTMLIHNKPEVFAVFVHSILTRLRMEKVGGILLLLEGESNKEVRAEIAQLCDKVMKF